MSEIVVSSAVLRKMYKHLETTYPHEGCGFLLGSDDASREISELYLVENGHGGDQRRRFTILPEDYLRAESYAEKNGLALLGVYHSHPDHPAIPSEHDLKQAVPFFSYIIVSVAEGATTAITSWQLDDDGEFEQEKIFKRESEYVYA